MIVGYDDSAPSKLPERDYDRRDIEEAFASVLYGQGEHTLESIADMLADKGLPTKLAWDLAGLHREFDRLCDTERDYDRRDTERVDDDWTPDRLDLDPAKASSGEVTAGKPASWGKMAPDAPTVPAAVSSLFCAMITERFERMVDAELYIMERTKDNSPAGERLAIDLAGAHSLFVQAIQRYERDR